jgi:phosphoribosylformylglycinamidine synthase PurS subunit
MKYIAEINVMPLPELLDPQGKAVLLGLHNLGIDNAASVRIGKHITLDLEAADEQSARALVDQACRKLLTNPIMEGFTYQLTAE